MSGFGRKGLDAGAMGGAIPVRGFGSQPAAAPDDGLSPAARAFIASERLRNEAGGARAAAPMSAFDSAALLQPQTNQPTKSLAVAYVLWWFGGPFGAHRFYLGAVSSGIAMVGLLFCGFLTIFLLPPLGLIMVGGVLVWNLVDAFLIPGLRRKHAQPKPKEDLAAVFA